MVWNFRAGNSTLATRYTWFWFLVRIFLAGTPAMVLPLFDKIFQSNIEVCGVLTNPPKPRGRSSEPVSSPVSKWAKENSLPIFENENLDEVSQKLREIDLVFVVAYGRIIPERFLNPFISGLTTGEVWAKLVAEASDEVVPKIREIIAGLPPVPQSEFNYSGKLQLAPKISASEVEIDWTESAEVICRKILAFNPAPSAWSVFRGERMLIHRALIHDNKLTVDFAPGQVLSDKNSLVIACGEGALEVIDLQPAGKKDMKAQDWLRGAKVQRYERFE
ncbi:MAG: hypothetical protein EBT44_00695 [Actinobacteria bacterium]|uniref:Methionyl-tRNA formyltransferase n=1 Tax=Candidatus Fonsibacter lacus TaxID=2576439 RepID=A0A965GBF8_9PROT|nr:hypothetical protein [Candidatus Fonsibacter lacus]